MGGPRCNSTASFFFAKSGLRFFINTLVHLARKLCTLGRCTTLGNHYSLLIVLTGLSDHYALGARFLAHDRR